MSLILKKEPFKLNTSKMNSIINQSSMKTSKNKSLVDPNGSSILQMSQQQIHFLNTQQNEVYQVSMFVRNVSDKKQEIRLKKPKSTYFTASLIKDGPIAPGLDTKITITYDSKDNERVEDYFTITSDTFECDIPIHVIPQAGKLNFQPFVNFGFIKVGCNKQITWKIENKGQTSTNVSLVSSLIGNCDLKIQPQNFMIEAKSERLIKFNITSQQAGHCQGVIDIEPKLFSISTVDFVANFCEFTRMISDDQGNPLSQIQVEPLFSGEEIEVVTNLVNNTPQSCEFRISRKRGSPNQEQNNLITPQQFGRDDSEKLISFNPSQGALEAYQSIPFITKVQAKFDESDQQAFCNYILGRTTNFPEQKDWSYTIKAHINGEENPLVLYIRGNSNVPKLSLGSTFFDFGDTPTMSRKQKTFKVQNFSEKAVKIEFKKTSNYSFSPQIVKINPKSNTYVNVTFCPKIVGDIKQTVALVCGIFSFPIKLLGKGVFQNKRNKSGKLQPIYSSLITSKCQEMNVDQMDNTFLQNEISNINDRKKGLSSFMDDHSKSNIHFESSYNNSVSQSFNGNSIYLTEHKKTKQLRDRNGKQVKIDTNNFNPNQEIQAFSTFPKNQQEERQIARQLTPSELTNIIVGPVIINIGKIFLRSIVKKTFHICNFNSKPISIQLNINNLESFSESNEQRQILPAQSWGGLAIKFQALKEGQFKHNLQYVLNGKHFFEMMIIGNVIQPTLTASKQEIKFLASEDDKSFQKKETIILSNSFEYEVGFDFKSVENSMFRVQPSNGTVKPNGHKTIMIYHRFDQVTQFGSKVQEILKVKITHGKTIDLKCISLVPECPCISKVNEINFKEVAIGKIYENRVVIKNTSKNFSIFQVQIPQEIQNLVSSNTVGGTLHGQQMVEIVFQLQAFSSMQLQSTISIKIRGGRTLNLPIKAQIISPKIRIQGQGVIDFGSTPIQGNPASKSITLINDSQIPVDLQFRLAYDSQICNALKVNRILDQNCTIFNADQKQKSYKSIVLRMNAKCKSNIILDFTPQEVETYQFILPLFIYNSSQPVPELQKNCICKGLKNKLMATEKQIDFGKIIIEQNLQSYQKSKTLQIRNPQQQAIDWWVEDADIYPFSLQKNKGRLEGHEKMNLKVFFYSDIQGDYSKQLQFFIDQNQEEQINHQYLKVTVKASASYPTLFFDQPYVIMPVVNLNEESTASFQIINGGYQNINLKHMIVQDFSNLDIKLNFVQGTNLGVTKKKIKVEVNFKSQKPISFTVKINFYDTNNRVFTIPVSGTTDNCIYTIIADQRMNNYSQQIQKDCTFLKHYVNSVGCLEDSLYQFPKSILENDLDKMNQFLCFYSSSFEKIKSVAKKNPRFFYSFDYLSEVIKCIKSQGGFLNQIRPEMLLSYNDYIEAIKMRAENNINILSNYAILQQDSFNIEHKRCWVILMYQVFKVYSRVSCGKTKNSQFWTKFSLREKTITNWLQQAYLSQAKTQYQKKKNVLQQLNDSQLLSSVISKYTNIKVLQVYGRQIKGLKQKERRIKNIIDTFSSIGINCHCRVQDVLRSSPKQMLLVIENLYLILPSYLQKGEPVVFSCALGQVITKSIQISNPSKHPITYMAKIQGAKAYSLQNDPQFVIESKGSHEVKIRYVSNINLNNSSATLTLTGKASAKFTPSTFIFVLNSQNSGRVSEKNIQVTGQLYEQYDFSLGVQNNFQSDGEFKVDLICANSNKAIPLSFFALNQTIKIKKGQTSNFNMIFVPLILDTQKCLIVFKDPKVGQFQYQLTGLVEQPQLSTDILKIPQTLLTNKKYSINLPIPFKNDHLIKARKIVENLIERNEKKSGTASKSAPNVLAEKYFPKVNSSQSYSVKIMPINEMIQLRNDTLSIRDTQATPLPEQGKKEDPKVGLQINMKVALKEANFILIIRNTTGSDFRKYKVLVHSVYKPLRYQLEMKVSINKSITQQLPLVNLSNQPNSFMVSLQTNQSSKGIYSIDREKQIIVQGKATQMINLTFKPKNQNTYNAIIKMQNITTGQLIEYDISGIGDEPESSVLTFDQQIRKEKSYSIKLPIERTTKCNVSKFTLQDAVYEKSFMLNNSNNSFKFKFTPKIPGIFQGKLIIEDDARVHAYRIQINARDIIEEQIKIKTIERKVYQGEIKSIPKGKYEVTCKNCNLKFNKAFESNDQNDGLFEFKYHATKPQEIQCFLTFNNDKIGQLTYLFKIKVEEMPQIKFEPFKTELGRQHQEIITFYNHHETQALKIQGVCSHPNSFFTEPRKSFSIPPNSEVNAKLIFKPSKLQMEEGKIKFTSNMGEKWNYHLSGYGLLQTKPFSVEMRANVGQQQIESISFINPLQNTVNANIVLENQQSDETFKLILKSSKFELKSQQQLILPIMVRPRSVKLNRCFIKITVSQKITFKYEICCLSEHFNSQQKSIKMQARVKKEELITINLPFMSKQTLSSKEKVKFNIVPLQQNMRHLLKDSVKVVNSESYVKNNQANFQLVVKAFKPFRTTALISAELANGCKWIQKYEFVFTAPVVDDKIEIIAEMNKPTSTRFKLTNRVKQYAKFKAYFTNGSASELNVMPKTGDLQPFGREGTAFEVIFAPNVYKKEWQGKLIVQTEDGYWSYDVKGMLPPYLPPIAKSSLRK